MLSEKIKRPNLGLPLHPKKAGQEFDWGEAPE